ncbi:hypothetical protein ACWEK5_41095 [Rhodococcus koreensis]
MIAAPYAATPHTTHPTSAAAHTIRHRARPPKDRPHRGSGERYHDHNHHHGDNEFVIDGKSLHARKPPSPTSRQSKAASARTDTALTA